MKSRSVNLAVSTTAVPGPAVGIVSCRPAPGWTMCTISRPMVRETIEAEMNRIAHAREETQPLRSKTGGSTFKNPPGDSAWRLVDAAGCRGLQMGGAQVSEKHANFLINLGGATAADGMAAAGTSDMAVSGGMGIGNGRSARTRSAAWVSAEYRGIGCLPRGT